MIRIYVASLSDYNAGVLHGVWIELGSGVDSDAVQEAVDAMLAASKQPNAEEWAIHDSEGFEGIPVDEGAGFDRLCVVADAIEEHGEPFVAWHQNNHGTGDLDDFEVDYRGTYADLAAYAEQFVDDCGLLAGVSTNVTRYFDYESYGRDLQLGGDVWTADVSGGVAVFSNN